MTVTEPRRFARRPKNQPDELPLDVQCWLLGVASVLCTSDHPASLEALGALRRALTRGSRPDIAASLAAMAEVTETSLCKCATSSLNLLIAEVKFGSSRRIRRLATDIVQLSLSGEKDAC